MVTGFMVEAITHLLGTRVAVVARRIRRLPSTQREEASLVVAMRRHTHRDEARHGKVVVLASSGPPSHVGSGENFSAFTQFDRNN